MLTSPSFRDIGHMIHHVSMGDKVKQCVNYFPTVALDCIVQPVTATVIKIELTITPQFEWNDRWHGKVRRIMIKLKVINWKRGTLHYCISVTFLN